MFQRITDRNILRVLVGGFGLVIVLLILAGFVGIRSVKAIQGSAAQLENEQLASSRLIDEIHREQGTLNAVFYNLGKQQPDSVDRDKVLTQLNDADFAIQRIVAAGAGTPEEADWRRLQYATEGFSNEARRLLGQEDAETLFSLDLLRQQEQVIQIIRKLMAAGRSRAEEAQMQINTRSEELMRQSFVLIGACVFLAMIFAILTVRITATLFRQMEEQSTELSSVTWHMLENQETTARRFSHELHDELGQCLTAVKANLMSLAEASIDMLFSSLCLQWVAELPRALTGFRRVLRPGGLLLFSTFGPDTLGELRDAFQLADAGDPVTPFAHIQQAVVLKANVIDRSQARSGFP